MQPENEEARKSWKTLLMQCDVTNNVKAMSTRLLTTLACKRTFALPHMILPESLNFVVSFHEHVG